jgi:hypothetical protein
MASWLDNALSKAKTPDKGIIDILLANMGGWEKARDHNTVHASDLTKPDFCPKQLALLKITGKNKKDMYVATALRATFDVGNSISDLVREQWLGKHAHGYWECRSCGTTSTFGIKPAYKCKCNTTHWRYVEANFLCQQYDVSGSIDVLVDLHAPKLKVTELKIITPVDFEALAAPLSEHRIRTNLYMKLIEGSDAVLANRINLQEAHVMYVSRAYGKKHAKYNEILPFKEFVVTRDDATLQPLLDKAKEIKVFKKTGVMPCGICATSMDPKAKNCSVAAECFSGQYNAGEIVMQESA